MDRVVFFGSGPVAAKSLELLAKNFEIEAVVTKPKPAHHHGDFPVLDIAEALKLPVKTVSNKADLDELMATKPFESEAGVLIDFGIIVSQKAIDYFPKGIINSHFSLLPEWRGADPITFSILSGQKQTGVSLMLLVEKMDEGPLLAQGVYDILPGETTPSLTDYLIKLSDALLVDALPSYINNTPAPKTQVIVKPVSQEEVCKMTDKPYEPTYSRKLTKEDGRIDWTKPAEQIEREIRAFIEWPKSYTTLAGKDVIITKAHSVPTNEPGAKPGDFEAQKDIGVIMVNTSNGSICIDTLKPAGKKEMTAAEFIRGYGKDL
ncbi:MAG: fmt, methionyl-tRNA formyltransferase [Candidatus Saccharibacteria bacterium]|nr:fmt, methionyl-tRNA formyltransferase [Candidatus Saccharibacteria bacterium]